MRTFGEKFEEMRQSNHITMKQVADAIGKSAVYVSDIQRGSIGIFTIEEIGKLKSIFGDEIVNLYNAYKNQDTKELKTIKQYEKENPGKKAILETKEGGAYYSRDFVIWLIDWKMDLSHDNAKLETRLSLTKGRLLWYVYELEQLEDAINNPKYVFDECEKNKINAILKKHIQNSNDRKNGSAKTIIEDDTAYKEKLKFLINLKNNGALTIDGHIVMPLSGFEDLGDLKTKIYKDDFEGIDFRKLLELPCY